MKSFIFIVILIFSISNSFLATSNVVYGLPSFPSAVGFGSDTIGGRGGRIIEVTNLNNSGSGSFRAACEATGARIVVFRTGGTVRITSNVDIRNPYITIAGQTAPGDGICIRGATLHIMTHDVIVRGLRVRPGDGPGPSCGNRDCIQISNSPGNPVYNVIVDHCSVSWGTDENLSAWYDVHDVTFLNCISSEALYNSCHPEGPHSKGMILGPDTYNISVIGCLLAHNHERNPLVDTANLIIANNIVYGRRWLATKIRSGNQGPQQVSIVGNLYRKSNNEPTFNKSIVIESAQSGSQIFIDDNICTGDAVPSGGPDYSDQSGRNVVVNVDAVTWPLNLTAKPSTEVYDWVLNNVGAYPDNRDSVDTRIITQVINQTGSLIDSQDEVGGWPILDPGTPPTDTDHDGMPDSWEIANGLNINNASDGNADQDGDGYTNVEEYINSLILMSGEVVPPPPSDSEAPTIPITLQAQVISSSQIVLSWNASTDNVGVTGYRIYRDGTQVANTASTTYQDTGLSPSTTYTYTVSAYDVSGNGSGQSISVSATTQEAVTIFSNLDSYLGDASNWEPLTSSRWGVVSDGGDLRYGINTTSYSNLSGERLGEYSLIQNRTYNDFTFTAKVKSTEDLSSNSSADYCIVFGYQDPNNYYCMMYNSNASNSQLFGIINGSRQLITDAANMAITDNAYHDVRLERTGSNIIVYIDGTEVINATDSTFSSGRVGIGGFNDASLWDDIIVTTSTSPPIPPRGFGLRS